MARDLLPSYPNQNAEMAQNQETRQPQDLLNDVSPEDQALGSARADITQRTPKMPDWLREGLLKLAQNKTASGIAKKAAPVSSAINKGFEASGIPDVIAPLGSAGLGAAQGIGNMGASLINTPAYLKELVTGQKQNRYQFPNLKKYAGNDVLSQLGFTGGEVLGPLLVPFGAAGKAASYAGKVGTGALTGFLTGEDPSGSRLASTVIGGALPGAMEIGKDVLKLGKKAIAKDVVAGKEALSNEYGKAYEGFKKSIETRGANKPELGKVQYDEQELNPFLTKNAKAAIAEFNKNPTVLQGHQLQSDLFKTAQELKNSSKDFISKQRLKEVNELRDQVKEKIRNHLIKSGHTDLALDYNQIGHGYKVDVAPYLRPHIEQMEKDLARGDSPAEAVSKLLNDKEFLKKVKGKHEGLHNRAALQNLIEMINPIRAIVGR